MAFLFRASVYRHGIVVLCLLLLSAIAAVGVWCHHDNVKNQAQETRWSQPQQSQSDPECFKSLSEIGLVAAIDINNTVKGISIPLGPLIEGTPRHSIPQLSVEDCRVIAALNGLEEAYLDRTGLSDQCIQELSGMRYLRILKVSHNPITDGGCAAISSLRNLEILDLSFTEIGDNGLLKLSALTGLRELSISGARVTVGGLRALEQLKHLERLELDNSHLSPDGLRHLVLLEKLKDIYTLEYDQLTPTTLGAVKRALPNCVIGNYHVPGEDPWPVWAYTNPPSFARLVEHR